MAIETKDLLKKIGEFTGQLKAAWKHGSSLMVEVLEHRGQHNQDNTLIGKMYNDLLKADHNTMAAAVKNCAFLCAGVSFKKDDKVEGRFIAYNSGKPPEEQERVEAVKQLLDPEKGLKSFRPERKAKGTGGSKNSRVHGMTEAIDNAIAKLETDPAYADYVTEIRGKLAVIFADVQDALQRAGYGTMAASMLKAMAPKDKAAAEPEEKEKDKAA